MNWTPQIHVLFLLLIHATKTITIQLFYVTKFIFIISFNLPDYRREKLEIDQLILLSAPSETP